MSDAAKRTATRSVEATYQPYAECVNDECGFETAPSSAARDTAKYHVRATGHSVRVIVEKVALYVAKDGA